ncbi:hypothetical protein SSS_10180 [Sarcoptes scabiei]|nr:hypothetical protein SSS_10180 [Sarcoptes scabiei]UXI19611.1 serpin SMSB3a variant [Sarcoptes scabiei]
MIAENNDGVDHKEIVIPNTKLVQALKQLSLERIKHEVKMQKEMFQVELQYQNIFKDFDEKRRQIISGEYTPTDDECKYEYADPEEPVVESEEKGISNFWSVIFGNLDILNEMVQESDQELIDLITNIRCVLLSDPMGYRLEFEFAENKFFHNKVLTKAYYFAENYDKTDPLKYDTPYVNRCIGCKIDWKSPEMNITYQKISKKMKHRNSNQIKVVEKMQRSDSFFNFFDPPQATLEDADDETKELLSSDFEIGETFRMNIIPRAIIYYTGEGIEDYSEDEIDEFDEEYDEDEDDDFDEDDIDDEDDDDDNDDADRKDEKNKSSLIKRNKFKAKK